MTIYTDNSSEIKNAENPEETKNLNNYKDMVHEKKTDTLLNVETGNEVKKEKFLIVEYPDNNLEDDVKDNNIRKHPNDDGMKEKLYRNESSKR